jgi:hypothetical protein
MAEMIVKAPFPMPEDPTPAIALPTINMLDDWAAPHNADPSTKTKKKDKKVHWMAAWVRYPALGLYSKHNEEAHLDGEVSKQLSSHGLKRCTAKLICSSIPEDSQREEEVSKTKRKCHRRDES